MKALRTSGRDHCPNFVNLSNEWPLFESNSCYSCLSRGGIIDVNGQSVIKTSSDFQWRSTSLSLSSLLSIAIIVIVIFYHFSFILSLKMSFYYMLRLKMKKNDEKSSILD